MSRTGDLHQLQQSLESHKHSVQYIFMKTKRRLFHHSIEMPGKRTKFHKYDTILARLLFCLSWKALGSQTVLLASSGPAKLSGAPPPPLDPHFALAFY